MGRTSSPRDRAAAPDPPKAPHAAAAPLAQGAGQLACWALGSTASGLAAVRGDTLLVSNRRFDAMDRRGEGRWRVAGNGRGRHDRLRDLVIAESHAAGDGAARVLRAHRGRDALCVEIQLERLAAHEAAPPVTVALVRDVGAQLATKRALAAARQAMLRRERLRVLGEIASGVAHDLNNNLNALTLRVDALARDAGLQAAHPGELGAMSRILADAAAVVARLQELSRRRKDRPSALVDLGEVVTHTVALLRRGIEPQRELRPATHVSVAASLPPDLPPVRGDEGELRQMLLNLILNARDAMPRGGRIDISAATEGGRVQLAVSDSGVGIAPRVMKHMFEPFFTTKGKRGTGLGLALAANMMHRLGGSIAADNRPEGGAVITVDFPAAPPGRAPPRRALPPPTPAAPLHILLIDDEADNLHALREVIELDGHAATALVSGAEAIARVRAGARYDLVLCDVGMPGLSGWQVTAELHRLAPEMTLYLLTGWAREIARGHRPRAGVMGVLAKPLSFDRLRAVISATVAGRPIADGTPVAPTRGHGGQQRAGGRARKGPRRGRG